MLAVLKNSSFNAALLFNLLVDLFAVVSPTSPLPSTSVQPSGIVALRSPTAQLQGKTYTFDDESKASAFLGIPYAKPPVGGLRFKRPQPADGWAGVRNASEFGSRCFYATLDDHGLKPSEDCLFLNVFTPQTVFSKARAPFFCSIDHSCFQPFARLLPVFFYVHGGGFQVDNAALLGDENICRYLNSKGVVVVTINYRLQLFGFLTIDEQTPGNAGLWDMRRALLWVRDNIDRFGGDPNAITVGGQSAGSIATDLLTISPQTRDLFNQAIMFAGTKECRFTVNTAGNLRTNAVMWAKLRGFQTRPGEKTEATPEKITIGYPEGSHFLANFTPITTPTLEEAFFLNKSLEELRAEAPKKRVVAGVTEYEGLLFMISRPPTINGFDYAKYYLSASIYADNRMNESVADAILSNFVNRSLPTDSVEFYRQSVAALSDYFFNYPTWLMAKRRVEAAEAVFLYRFTYFKNGTLGNSRVLKFYAATHTLELPYFFGKSILPFGFQPDEEDAKKIEEFTSDPNGGRLVRWEPYAADANGPYFLFGQNSTEDRSVGNFGDGRLELWDSLYAKYGLKD
ncbi:Carboxylic ester hydrolase [Aphelenchoides fujianensis]|nr:Carboxylic ester hydrolase [Aphelenchoides fujianensis]